MDCRSFVSGTLGILASVLLASCFVSIGDVVQRAGDGGKATDGGGSSSSGGTSGGSSGGSCQSTPPCPATVPASCVSSPQCGCLEALCNGGGGGTSCSSSNSGSNMSIVLDCLGTGLLCISPGPGRVSCSVNGTACCQ